MLRFRMIGFFTLVFGLLAILHGEALALAGKKEQAEKYTNDLKTSKDAKVRVEAIEELAKIGQIQKPLIQEALPLMIAAMTDTEVSVRSAALKSVGMVDPNVKEVMPIYRKAIKDEKNEAARIAAIQGLAAMGPNAKEGVQDLRKIMKEEDKKSKLYKAAQSAVRVINAKR